MLRHWWPAELFKKANHILAWEPRGISFSCYCKACFLVPATSVCSLGQPPSGPVCLKVSPPPPLWVCMTNDCCHPWICGNQPTRKRHDAPISLTWEALTFPPWRECLMLLHRTVKSCRKLDIFSCFHYGCLCHPPVHPNFRSLIFIWENERWGRCELHSPWHIYFKHL